MVEEKFQTNYDYLLQRSRALSSAEISLSSAWLTLDVQASTEPRSFERGDPLVDNVSRSILRFNGAALFRARRSCSDFGHGRARRSFNGAALFRARRLADLWEDCGNFGGFNGAALFRARRCARRAEHRHRKFASTEPRSFERGDAELLGGERGGWGASTEPRSFERGDILKALEGCEIRLASTEPRSFERGDPDPHPHESAPPPASTEPRSFERGDSPQFASVKLLPRRFNGAALFRARRCSGGLVLPPPPPSLQRSRALSSAEMARRV